MSELGEVVIKAFQKHNLYCLSKHLPNITKKYGNEVSIFKKNSIDLNLNKPQDYAIVKNV